MPPRPMRYRQTFTHATFTGLVLIGLTVQAPTAGLAQDDTWENLASMPTARLGLCAGSVDGKVYAIGGYPRAGTEGLTTVEMYDPAINSWTTREPMPTPRRWLACSVLNGSIYAIGGFRTEGTPALTTVEIYDPASDSWSVAAPLPGGRKGLATAVVDGKLYAIGGADPNEQLLATMDVYDPTTDSWSSRSPMPTARAMLSASAVDGMILAVGGPGPGLPGVSTVEAYDPGTDAWVSRADLPEPRWGLSSRAIDGHVFAIGGANFSSAYAQVVAYDPATDNWVSHNSIGSFDEPGDGARWGFATAVVDGRIYAIGGATNPARPPHPGTSRMQVYTPPAIQTGAEEHPAGRLAESGIVLRQNFPNPFSSSTAIPYELARAQFVRLIVFDTLGRIVRVLDAGTQTAGRGTVVFDTNGLPSGVYLYRLEGKGATGMRSMLLVD